jgi:hypothetical protein
VLRAYFFGSHSLEKDDIFHLHAGGLAIEALLDFLYDVRLHQVLRVSDMSDVSDMSLVVDMLHLADFLNLPDVTHHIERTLDYDALDEKCTDEQCEKLRPLNTRIKCRPRKGILQIRFLVHAKLTDTLVFEIDRLRVRRANFSFRQVELLWKDRYSHRCNVSFRKQQNGNEIYGALVYDVFRDRAFNGVIDAHVTKLGGGHFVGKKLWCSSVVMPNFGDFPWVNEEQTRHLPSEATTAEDHRDEILEVFDLFVQSCEHAKLWSFEAHAEVSFFPIHCDGLIPCLTVSRSENGKHDVSLRLILRGHFGRAQSEKVFSLRSSTPEQILREPKWGHALREIHRRMCSTHSSVFACYTGVKIDHFPSNESTPRLELLDVIPEPCSFLNCLVSERPVDAIEAVEEISSFVEGPTTKTIIDDEGRLILIGSAAEPTATPKSHARRKRRASSKRVEVESD